MSPVTDAFSPATRAGSPRTGERRRQAAPARAGLGVFLAIVLLALNLRTIVASLPPLLAEVRGELGLSAAAAGLLTTLPVLCFGALAPLAPLLARRVPIERLVVACGLLTAGAAALRGAGGAAPLFTGSVLAGVAIALAQAVLPAFIRTRFPAQAGPLTGAFSMSLTLGAALAAGAAVPLERLLGGSWAASLAAWAVPAALATVLWLPAALGAGTVVRGAPPPALWRRPLAWSVSLFFGVQSMTFYAGLAWLPSVLEDAGYEAGEAGALQALGNVLQIVPAFVLPILAARRSQQAGLLAAVVLLSVAAPVGLLAAPGAAPLWMVLLGLGQGGALGLALILPVLRGGDAATVASLTAMALCVGYLVAATGPWLLGAVHDATDGWSVPLVLLAALTALELVPGLAASRGRTLTPARSL
ncbi:MAG TPA: MFS transporter [Solirubrobacteraceae bacterium]|nr:MFS transporter [Solirubrobacteraceae bacterium]